MSKKGFKLPKAKCLRCQHEWTPRKKETKVCPKCHSAYWNTPKTRGEVSPVHENA